MKTAKPKPLKFVIDRKRWLHGERDSVLLRSSDSKMCCLGFYCRAIGLESKEIRDAAVPTGIETNKKLPRWLGTTECTASVVQLIVDNDNEYLLDDVREERIKKGFARHNVDVIFKGKY